MNRKKAADKQKIKAIHIKYRIVLNFSRMVEIYYSHAYGSKQALQQVFHKVAKRHDVSLSTVRGMFNGSKDNFSVEIDPEWAKKNGYKIGLW